MHIINDLLTGLLGPYKKYEALTFTHCPYEKDPGFSLDRLDMGGQNVNGGGGGGQNVNVGGDKALMGGDS